MLKILKNLPLFATSAAGLNEHRRFLHNSETKAVTYVLYTLKLELWLRSNPILKSFYYAMRPKIRGGQLVRYQEPHFLLCYCYRCCSRTSFLPSTAH